MTNWLQLVASRIRWNLRFSRVSEKQKEAVIQDELTRLMQEQEIGGAPEKKKPEEEDPLVRGEKLSSLRKRAKAFGGWES